MVKNNTIILLMDIDFLRLRAPEQFINNVSTPNDIGIMQIYTIPPIVLSYSPSPLSPSMIVVSSPAPPSWLTPTLTPKSDP